MCEILSEGLRNSEVQTSVRSHRLPRVPVNTIPTPSPRPRTGEGQCAFGKLCVPGPAAAFGAYRSHLSLTEVLRKVQLPHDKDLEPERQ